MIVTGIPYADFYSMVARTAAGQIYWRKYTDGSWARSHMRDGPWIVTNVINVPREVLRCYAEYMG